MRRNSRRKSGNGGNLQDDNRKMEKQILRLFLHFYFTLYPPLFFPASLVGILQHFLDVGFLVEHFSLKKVIRDDTERAVLLQGAPAYPEYAGQFLVRQEAFSLEQRLGGLFHVGQHSFQIFQSLEKDFDVRVFPLYEMVTHGFLFKG